MCCLSPEKLHQIYSTCSGWVWSFLHRRVLAVGVFYKTSSRRAARPQIWPIQRKLAFLAPECLSVDTSVVFPVRLSLPLLMGHWPGFRTARQAEGWCCYSSPQLASALHPMGRHQCSPNQKNSPLDVCVSVFCLK